MKKIFKKIILILFMVFLISGMTSKKTSAQNGVSVSFGVFYDNLSPYGQWIQDPYYGYAWVPSVGSGFRPYFSSGHWVLTEYGNMWVSDYPWGWAPFHYGRWTHDGFYGWVWIPDTEWGPAWVSWRSSPDYFGWCPLGPGISISMAFGSYSPPVDWWVFVGPSYIYQPGWSNYYYGPRNNTTIIRNTTIINNTYSDNQRTYIAGPRASDVQRVTNTSVPVYKVASESRPGTPVIENNTVKVYRPDVEKSGREIAPPKVKKAEQPIGKPSPIESGSRTQPGQKQIESPQKIDDTKMNKETEIRNKSNEQKGQPVPRREETQPARERTAPVREQPKREASPVIEQPSREAAPHPEKKTSPSPKQENAPVPEQKEERQLPPGSKQEQQPPQQPAREQRAKEQPSPQTNPVPENPRPGNENIPPPQKQERQLPPEQSQPDPGRNKPQRINPPGETPPPPQPSKHPKKKAAEPGVEIN